MTEYTEEQAKSDADALVARLEADPALRDALAADPRRTLTDAGLPAATVDELEQVLAGAEVEGFAFVRGADSALCHAASMSIQFQTILQMTPGGGSNPGGGGIMTSATQGDAGSQCCGHF